MLLRSAPQILGALRYKLKQAKATSVVLQGAVRCVARPTLEGENRSEVAANLRNVKRIFGGSTTVCGRCISRRRLDLLLWCLGGLLWDFPARA
jgi:hypothetical protein